MDLMDTKQFSANIPVSEKYILEMLLTTGENLNWTF